MKLKTLVNVGIRIRLLVTYFVYYINNLKFKIMKEFLLKAMRFTLDCSKVLWAWLIIIEVIMTSILTFMPNVDGAWYWFMITMEVIITSASRYGISSLERYVKSLEEDEVAVG